MVKLLEMHDKINLAHCALQRWRDEEPERYFREWNTAKAWYTHRCFTKPGDHYLQGTQTVWPRDLNLVDQLELFTMDHLKPFTV